MKFSDYRINDQLKANIETMGFKKPTDIQFKSIPPILRREDVLAIAQTGTGKTAAFVIPIIHNLLKNKAKHADVRCVVMVPTHELAQQIAKVFVQFSEKLTLRTVAIYGGVSQDEQIEDLKRGVDILVATPGRLFDLRSQGYIELQNLEILILDEADYMLDLGFINDIKDLLHFIPKKRQTLFFSATIDDRIKKLAYSIVKNPMRIQISPKNPVAKTVEHGVVFIPHDDKRFFLERIAKEYPEAKILVFVRTRVRAERVKKAMERVEIQSVTMHGEKDQEERQVALNSFVNSDCKMLIATDVSARGIDVPNVDLVINYDFPERPENYVHRVGRTGRGSKQGQAIAFCGDDEKPMLLDVETYLGASINVIKLEHGYYQETIDFSAEVKSDWKTLIKEEESFLAEKKKKKNANIAAKARKKLNPKKSKTKTKTKPKRKG
ncbi:MAG: ATP-dependent RNA helicase RhlE [Bacteroidia bacterium]|jgi:ATP-dependent RNA helicase RhlE